MGLRILKRFRGRAASVLVLVLYFVDPLMGFTQTLYEGDECEVNSGSGVCKKLIDCPSVYEKVLKNEQPEKVCSFYKEYMIVCCPNLSNESIDTQINMSFANREECIPPFENLKKKGPQYLAWNKCVEFSQQMYTCVDNGNGWEPKDRRKCDKVIGFAMIGTRIIEGTVAAEMEFPHMALLGYTQNKETKWLAGGTLISELYVLTAAHVLESREGGFVDLVRLGVLDRTLLDEKATYRVVERTPHPDYNIIEKCYSDIGLIKLDRKVQFTERIHPACLPSPPVEQYRKEKNPDFKVTGWGVTDKSHTELTDVLRKVTINEFHAKDCLSTCKKEEEWNNNKLICAGSRKSRADSCQGDSGGPLQITINDFDCPYAVIGIVSTGANCGFQGMPATYTNVLPYINWITNITWPNET